MLKSNGYLMDEGGSEKILMPFSENGEGNYYIVVCHRNHLNINIMSAGTHYLESSGYETYDFADAQDKAWGTAPMKELASGVFGMVTRDADGDGVIGAADCGLVFNNGGRVSLVP